MERRVKSAHRSVTRKGSLLLKTRRSSRPLNQNMPVQPKTISVTRIFNLQDAVLKKNIEDNLKRYTFVVSCIELVAAVPITDQCWSALPKQQKIIYNMFHGDCFSTIVNSLKLCLYGCETDSYALMRVVLESLTVFDHINEEELHTKAYDEIVSNAPKSKSFSKLFDFKAVLRQQKNKDRRGRLKGFLSNIGSHLSPTRLARNRLIVDGQSHPKPGASVENPRINEALGELAAIALFFVKVVDEFYQKYIPQGVTEYHIKAQYLEKEYDSMK